MWALSIYIQLGPGLVSLSGDSESESESHSVVSDSLRPHGLYSPWNSTDQNTGVGSRSFLQGIFPTQGSNPGLPHCRRIFFYQLSHKGSPLSKYRIQHCIFLISLNCLLMRLRLSPACHPFLEDAGSFFR